MAQTQAILDALTKLSGDSDDVGTKKDDAAAKKQASADAAHASEVADNAVTASQGQLVADKKALIDLVDSTFPT